MIPEEAFEASQSARYLRRWRLGRHESRQLNEFPYGPNTDMLFGKPFSWSLTAAGAE
jgi:hypothetical protein